MKALRSVTTLAAALLVSGSCMASSTNISCKQKLRVGVTLPLSGPLSHNGEGFRNGVRLADEVFDSDDCVTFIFEDDQLKPQLTITAAHKLIGTDHIDGMISFGTPTSLAVAPLFERQHIPLVAVTVLKRVNAGYKSVLRHFPDTASLGAAIEAEVRARGYKRVAVVTTLNEANLSLRDSFIRSESAPVVFNETYANDETDFQSAIAKVVATSPDAVYLLLFSPQPANFMKKLRAAGYRGDVFGAHNIEDAEQIKAAGGAMEGIWFFSGADNRGEGFHVRYKAAFGGQPPFGSSSGFDLGKMMIEAAHQGRPLNDYLHTIKDFKGAFGQYSVTSEADFPLPVAKKVVAGNTFELLP